MDGIDIQSFYNSLYFYATEYGLRIVIALVIFIVGRWVAQYVTRIVRTLMVKAKVDETLRPFLRNLLYYMMLAMVVIASLSQAGINVTSFLAVLGAAGLAVGLALKDSLSNFAAGVIMIMLRFFKRGDYITAAGESGTVTAINIFNTVLTTPDNKVISIPNAAVLGGTITNVTANATRRVDLVFGIGYGRRPAQGQEDPGTDRLRGTAHTQGSGPAGRGSGTGRLLRQLRGPPPGATPRTTGASTSP